VAWPEAIEVAGQARASAPPSSTRKTPQASEKTSTSAQNTPRRLIFDTALSDFSSAKSALPDELKNKDNDPRRLGPVTLAIDDDQDTGWGIVRDPGRRNESHEAIFILKQPITIEDGQELRVTLVQKHGGPNADLPHSYNIGRLRLSLTCVETHRLSAYSPRARAAADKPSAKRSARDWNTLFSDWRERQPRFEELNARIDTLFSSHPEGTTALVLKARPKPRITTMFDRGEYAHPGRAVTPGVPAALHPLPEGSTPTRLTFARWLVAPNAPTTARVYMNRLWQSHFGTGLVETPEDFGTQSPAPSHPELLDWLATEFMSGGWRIKRMHKLIVTSRTYRQSSDVRPEAWARDPKNRWLARGPRVRLEAETIRDMQLVTSGLLDASMGGPPVKPPAPAFLFEPPASYSRFPWEEAKGPSRYRRAIYTYRRRSTPYPFLQVFDAPEGNTACVRRERSNTPLQALTTLNEPVSLEAARALGRIMFERAGHEQDRMRVGFQRVLGRDPDATELEALTTFSRTQQERLERGWIDPWLIVGGPDTGPPDVPEGASPVDWARMTLAARVLLNLGEAMTRP
jgi:hypothetical protein